MKLINNKVALAVCVALSLAACSPEKTSEEYLSAAKANINAEKKSDAIIALKNAVRVDLQNAEARVLLGSLYLSMGESAAAEKELSRALALNGDVKNTLPQLLKALNLQNKSKETITLIAEYDEVSPEILLYQALAYNRLDEKSKAVQSIEQANELSAESIYSQLGDAYFNVDLSDIASAIENIDKILAVDPNLTEALIFKGQLHFAQKDYRNAINAFNEYHRLLPGDVQIRLFLANTYIKDEQFDEANKQLDYLLKLVPEHPFTNQLKGLIKYQKSEYKQSLAYTEKAIQNGLNTPSNRVVAGLSAFKLEQYELSHQYLVTLSESLSSTHPVRRVLALVQMQLGYNTDAGNTLEALEGVTSQDVNLFTTASFELLKSGKIDEAKKLLAKTENVFTDSSEEMTKIGILKLSMNDLEGLADLEKAIEIDPELPMAKVALAAAYIENKEYDKALDLAEKWKLSQPDKVEGYNLAAKILLIQNHHEQAEQELKQALSLNDNNAYSRLYFATKHLSNNQPEEAIKHLESIFSVSPTHLTALQLNYRAHKVLSSETVAIDKIEQSYNTNKDNIAYRLLYARVSFIEKDFNKTIELLENIKITDDAPAIQWALLGDSYLKLNQNNKALTVFDDWIAKQPQYRAAWLRKISAQEKLADYRSALSTVEQVLVKAPEDSQFNVLRVNYLILTKELGEAQVQIDSLTEEQKELPLVKGLQGKIWVAEGRYKKALSGLKALYGVLPSPYNTALLFATYRKLEQENVGFDFMQKHIEKYPNDDISRNLLAESVINVDHTLAKKHYLVLLTASPDNLSILNNLAWVEYQLGEYQSASKYAQRAIDLDGNHPQVLDTAGLIQLKLGDKKKAIELLTKAKLFAPNDGEIAKHYQEATEQ